jgi:response regulator RpfG family c-di-GMP phosphodiesterase
MIAERSYRMPMPKGAALRELVNKAGTQFDPHVVRSLMSVIHCSVLTPSLPELTRYDEQAVASAR